MTRLLYTIWALVLNSLGMSIFHTCFADSMEDEYGEPLLSGSGSLIASFLIAASVYVIVVSCTIFPESFRKPKPILICLYEFLVTAFFIEFAIACVWMPIEVLVRITLPKKLCHTFGRLGFEDAVETLNTYKLLTTILTNGIAVTFLLTTLYVTKAVDFRELTDNGAEYFLLRSSERLWQRIRSELPKTNNKENKCRCRSHRGKNRSRNRTNNHR